MAGIGDLKALAADLKTFASERDWEQFDSPTTLGMAITIASAARSVS